MGSTERVGITVNDLCHRRLDAMRIGKESRLMAVHHFDIGVEMHRDLYHDWQLLQNWRQHYINQDVPFLVVRVSPAKVEIWKERRVK